ncbi:MAG: shikimate dehydrogenase [Betaproteobacteria bacterium]|nr:shikimate dehydrogenase [Betaproteobacteria bacterium]MSQ88114.1 shikimate dehydrogenase [Betaproteobacteria bacterium]
MPDCYVVIGNPVAHSKSPWIHAQFARQLRQDIEYARIEAPLDGFARTVDAFRAAGGRGANVTLPFKEQAFVYCRDAVSLRARVAGVVNTLIFEGGGPASEIRGDNTDGVGLLRDITVNLGRAIMGQRVLLMGAGGAAQGVLGPLLGAGPQCLVIANRSAAKARSLAQRHGAAAGGGYDELGGAQFDLLINATSAGLADEAPPLPPSAFAPGALGYDMVYGRDTPFLAMARAAGAEARDGGGMLVEQAAESFFLWRGLRPDTAPVLAALRQP